MILQVDARSIPLTDESVQAVITSPPYWGLRAYGTKSQVWGGDAGCCHKWGDRRTGRVTGGADRPPDNDSPSGRFTCGICGAWSGELGLEPTPELYVEHIVGIFREVRRVLRKDGTVWLNLGDSYAGSWGNYHPTGRGGQRPKATERFQREAWGDKSFKPPMADAPGLKPKDLCGIPWRLALALQQDGWWLRSDIIWSKPNPMPESVMDRPTRAHEYIFLLTKSDRYFYDADAVREPHTEPWRGTGEREHNNWSINGQRGSHQTVREYNPAGRNIRSVWTIITEPFPDAHFATFPQEIPKRCILAGTSEKGACVECGAPWERVTDRIVLGCPTVPFKHDAMTTHGEGKSTLRNRVLRVPPNYSGKWVDTDEQSSGNRILQNLKAARDGGSDHDNPFPPPETTGWQSSCKCGTEETRPCVVLDPFCGSGTTVKVAQDLGRTGIGLDLKWDYLQMGKKRSAQMGLRV